MNDNIELAHYVSKNSPWQLLSFVFALPAFLSWAIMLSPNSDVVAIWEVSLPDGIHVIGDVQHIQKLEISLK